MHVDVILHIIITTLWWPSPDATYNFITPKMKELSVDVMLHICFINLKKRSQY